MVTLQAVRDEFQQVSRLYRLAKNPLERASIARFILKSAVAYHISDKFFREDTTVYLHGTKYIMVDPFVKTRFWRKIVNR